MLTCWIYKIYKWCTQIAQIQHISTMLCGIHLFLFVSFTQLFHFHSHTYKIVPSLSIGFFICIIKQGMTFSSVDNLTSILLQKPYTQLQVHSLLTLKKTRNILFEVSNVSDRTLAKESVRNKAATKRRSEMENVHLFVKLFVLCNFHYYYPNAVMHCVLLSRFSDSCFFFIFLSHFILCAISFVCLSARSRHIPENFTSHLSYSNGTHSHLGSDKLLSTLSFALILLF